MLRINVDRSNIKTATEILNEIPEKYRNRIAVNVSNLYQEENKISTYEIYKIAIELGYQYVERKNQYIACHTCLKEGYVLDTDANIVICPNASSDRIIGRLDDKGNVCITNQDILYKVKTASMLKNTLCVNCVKLPFCIAMCKKSIYNQNSGCKGNKMANGLCVEEIAKLDYLYDKKSLEEERKIENEQ